MKPRRTRNEGTVFVDLRLVETKKEQIRRDTQLYRGYYCEFQRGAFEKWSAEKVSREHSTAVYS